MATWDKVKFFYDNMLASGVTATTTASGYSIDNLYNWLETNMWVGSSTADHYITMDTTTTDTADYVCILGHNFGTATATVVVQYSTDDFAADINDAYTPEAVTVDTVYFKEFTTQTKRYWRIKITLLGVAPQMTLASLGETVELDYVSTSFDPYKQKREAIINKTQGGFVSGIHEKYTERMLDISFNTIDDTLYTKFKTWFETHGIKNLFIGWELANNPSEVWLMRPSQDFSAPFDTTSTYRNISLSFKGRKE